MKILRTILTTLFVSLSFLLQAKHLEFMGLPISGTISVFQTKLQGKGCTVMKDNNQLPTGIRGFNGVFAGKDCNIYVWYNHRTKVVYKVRAVTECGSSIESARNTFTYFKNLLNQKYEEVALTSDMIDDYPNDEYNFYIMVIDPPIQEGAQIIGTISLSIIDYDTIPTSYGVAITYEDFENSTKNENDTLNDL